MCSACRTGVARLGGAFSGQTCICYGVNDERPMSECRVLMFLSASLRMTAYEIMVIFSSQTISQRTTKHKSTEAAQKKMDKYSVLSPWSMRVARHIEKKTFLYRIQFQTKTVQTRITRIN